MDVDTLREHYRERPFQPFRIHMSDGRQVRVDHPELMMISPGGVTAVVYERDGRHHFLAIDLITGVELSGEFPPPPGAGPSF